MHIYNSKDGYWFTEEGIKIIEERYNAKYMGYWCSNHGGRWQEVPLDVFYVENPDPSKGHSNYFGMFRKGIHVAITDASSCFSEPITGVLCPDGEVAVSRYRHDYRNAGSGAIDGGRDYLKLVGEAVYYPKIKVTVDGGEFKFEVKND
jgi:hypothetical protein